MAPPGHQARLVLLALLGPLALLVLLVHLGSMEPPGLQDLQELQDRLGPQALREHLVIPDLPALLVLQDPLVLLV